MSEFTGIGKSSRRANTGRGFAVAALYERRFMKTAVIDRRDSFWGSTRLDRGKRRHHASGP